MRWIQTVFRRLSSRIKSPGRHSFTVLIPCMILVAAMVLLISGFSESGKNHVYAVQASDMAAAAATPSGNGGLGTGISGILDSVNSMREFSRSVSSVDITTENEQVLAGISKVRRGALNRIALGKGTSRGSGIGYYAQRAVRENHMASEDYYSLLQIVEAEATGGDMKSKILVANVVLNRVADDRFPDSIYGVIWDHSAGCVQFSPTVDGRIYTVEITDDTYEAVDRALNGEDYSEGALFFMARSAAESYSTQWFDGTLQWLFEYGGHEYYTFSDN